jgi:uncharacterized protein (TIGR04141 family)
MEKAVHHLSIFLVKEAFSRSAQIIKTDDCNSPIEIPISGYGRGRLYIKHTHNVTPKWAALFSEATVLNLRTENVGAAFLFKVDHRYFVLTFGQSGRFLMQDDVYEERFGLLVALNSVDEKSFRCVDKQSLDTIESHSRIQSGQETTSDEFGLDVEQDMLKAIVGTPLDHTLGGRMTGTDSLSVSVRMALGDLPHLLRAYKAKFDADLSATKYQWVNNIAEVKHSASLVEALETALVEKITQKDPENVWLSIPEIIDWTAVRGFMYTHGKRGIHRDINLHDFLATIGSGQPVTVELLKHRHICCADENHQKVHKSWSVFKCLYAEIDHNQSKYILNDGKWFLVSHDFVDRTNADFAKIPMAKLALPVYTEGGEAAYNAAVAEANPKQFALLDDDAILHGRGKGKVEVCDLFSVDRQLIHVKRYGKSSVLSHLFAQGYVSAELLLTDAEFRGKVRAKLKAPFIDLIPEKRPNEGDFTVIYAVISDAPQVGLHLPFFSRVNINNTARILRGYGYSVELLKIGVDPSFAKKTTYPASIKGH